MFHGMMYMYLLDPLASNITEMRMSYYVVPYLDERVEIIERLASKFLQQIS